MREYALKFDDSEFGKAVELALATCPSIESLAEELENAGFEDVDVEIRQTTPPVRQRARLRRRPREPPANRPRAPHLLAREDLKKPLEYVRDAIDKYWAEGKLELTLNVGCASARVAD